jgi:N-acetyltransferase
MTPEDTLPPQTHHAPAVSVPGCDGRFLVDVGFGGQTFSSPIRLEAGHAQSTRHEPYRLRRRNQGYVLEAQIRDTREPLYLFTTQPQPLIDLQVGSWFAATHPTSYFVVGLTAALATDDARWNLRGRNLAIHRGDETRRIRFDTAAEVADAFATTYAKGGGPAGSGGAAAGTCGVDGGVVDVELLPIVGGPAGVVGVVVFPAPPSLGGEVDEEVVDVVGAAPLVVGSVRLACTPPQATVTAPIVTRTPAPTTAPSILIFGCCDFTSCDPCFWRRMETVTAPPPPRHSTKGRCRQYVTVTATAPLRV